MCRIGSCFSLTLFRRLCRIGSCFSLTLLGVLCRIGSCFSLTLLGLLCRIGSWHWSVLPLYPGYHKTVDKIITTSDSLLIKKRKSTWSTAMTGKYWVTVWLTPGVSGIQPMTWGQASGISWHRLSPRENYFRSAVQNVPKAFNVLPDILMSGNV